jgi:hypothetical protein
VKKLKYKHMKMKQFFLTTGLLMLLLTWSCLKPKSLRVVVIDAGNKMYAFGDPRVEFEYSGARLNYLIPGTIVAFKAKYVILGQEGLPGELFQIDRYSQMKKTGTFDTSMAVMDIMLEYIYRKDQIIEDKELIEVDLE